MSQKGIFKLSVRPTPFSDEGVKGYLMRLANDNGLDQIGYRVIPRFNPTLEDLSVLLGRDDQAFWDKHPQAAFWGKHSLKAAAIWNWKRRQFCPICLQKKKYWRSEWELRGYTTCATHGARLIDRCPNCKKQLAWHTCGVTNCDCGHDLRLTAIEYATSDEVLLAQTILATLGIGNCPDRLRYLSRLTTRELFHIAQYLGNIDSNSETPNGYAEREVDVVKEVFATASSYLCNWPERFHQHLSKSHKEVSPDRNPASLNQIYGKTYTGLYVGLQSDAFQFVRNEFERYIQNNWQWTLCSRNQRLSQKTRAMLEWVPAAQAAKLLHVRSSYITEKVLRGEMIGHSFTTKKGNRQVVVHISEVENEKRIRSKVVNLMEASEILHIADKRVIELVDANVIQPISRPDIKNAGQWQFHIDSLINLLDLAKDAPTYDKNTTAEYIYLKGFLKNWKRGENSLPKLIKAVIDGELQIAGVRGVASGIPGWLIHASDYSAWIDRSPPSGSNLFNVQQLASILGIKEEVAYQLVKTKLIGSHQALKNGRPITLLTQGDLNQFANKFVFNSYLANELKTLPRSLLAKFAGRDVHPYLRIGKGSFRQAIFERTPQFEQSWETISSIAKERTMNTGNNSLKEKQLRIVEVQKVAKEVFGSSDKAKRWLRMNNMALGCTPISMLDTETGGKEVLKILGSIASGGVA